MGDQLVTDESPDRTGGGESRLPVFSRYGEVFEEMCGYYMSLGMSYHDYWDGDSTMTKYYKDADEYKRERDNFNLWLQAAYMYEVLIDVSPVLKPFVKHPKPKPFLSEPVSLGRKRTEKRKEAENQKKMQNGKNAMMAMMATFNKQFTEKQKKGGEVNNGS